MAKYIRARSIEQKKERMNEIMKMADHLFHNNTYHDITLTSLAEALGWSRGNLYKYITTKEEIFLELFLEKQNDYFAEIQTTFKNFQEITDKEFSRIWTDILMNHFDYLKYYGILATIIETNVAIDKLAEFKRISLSDFGYIVKILQKQCNITEKKASDLYWALIFHACGLNNVCDLNPMCNKGNGDGQIACIHS